MKIAVRHSCTDFTSYRAERVKSLFNCESGADFSLDAELPLEGREENRPHRRPVRQRKSSIGAKFFGPDAVADLAAGWPARKPVIDAMPGEFDQPWPHFPPWASPCSRLACPFAVLSNGEKSLGRPRPLDLRSAGRRRG